RGLGGVEFPLGGLAVSEGAVRPSEEDAHLSALIWCLEVVPRRACHSQRRDRILSAAGGQQHRSAGDRGCCFETGAAACRRDVIEPAGGGGGRRVVAGWEGDLARGREETRGCQPVGDTRQRRPYGRRGPLRAALRQQELSESGLRIAPQTVTPAVCLLG